MWSNLSGIIQAFVARLQVQREEGQALVEYALILALVSIAVIATLTGLANAIIAELGKVVTAL